MRVTVLFICLLLPIGVFAESKTISKIDYVYVLNTEKSFDFSGGQNHECGSNLYRTNDATEEITNRKFSLVLAAYTAGKKVIINTEGCAGSRMKFGWIRIID